MKYQTARTVFEGGKSLLLKAFFAVCVLLLNANFIGIKAASNDTTNFQGKIVIKSSGNNITSNAPACVVSGSDTCDFRVSYFTETTGGTSLYTEEFSNIEIGSYEGVFNLPLGAGTKTGGSESTYTDVFVNNDSVFMSIEFDTTGTGAFSSPEVFTTDGTNRLPIRAAAYAISATRLADSNNQFIKNQAGVQTGASFNIDGAGSIAGNFSVDVTDNTFFVNSTSNRVGIGTTSPGALFSVGTNSQFKIDANGSITTSGSVTFSSLNSGLLKTNADGLLSIATAGVDFENALTFSAPFSRIGNTISISEASGTVDGYLSAEDWLRFDTAATDDHGDLGGLTDDDHTQYALLAGRTAGQMLVGSSDVNSGLTFRSTSAVGTTGADIIFQTGNNGATEAMRILNNGRIGVGTATPGYTFDVSGSLHTSQFITPYTHEIIVDQNGHGDYTTITAAIAAINTAGDATANAPYQINLKPGYYVESFTIPEYTSISGDSIRTARIMGVVQMSAFTNITNLNIFVQSTTDIATLITAGTNANQSSTIYNCYIGNFNSVNGDTYVVRHASAGDLRIYNTFIYGQNKNVGASARTILVENSTMDIGDIEVQQSHLKSSCNHSNYNCILAVNNSTFIDTDVVVTGSSWSVFNDRYPKAAINNNSNGQIKLDISYENDDGDYAVYTTEGDNVMHTTTQTNRISIQANEDFNQSNLLNMGFSRAITQANDWTGAVIDLDTNVTNATYNQTGLAIKLASTSPASSKGITFTGVSDIGIDFSTLTTSAEDLLLSSGGSIGGTNGDLYINSSGYVGVGNTNPGSLLSVGSSSNGSFGGLPIAKGVPTIGVGVTSGEASIGLSVNDGTNNRRAKFFVDQDAGVWGLGNTYTTGGNAFVIINAATERFRIDNAGDVGIGTSDPLYKLQVAGTGTLIQAGTSTAGTTIMAGGYATFGEVRGGSAFFGDNVRSSTSVSGQLEYINDSSVWGARAIYMKDEIGIAFHTSDGATTAGNAFTSERMRIDETGKVGINNTAPTYLFDIAGSSGASTVARILATSSSDGGKRGLELGGPDGSSITGPFIKMSGTTGTFSFKNSSGTDTFAIENDGDVGIGTYTPGYKLDVNGSANVASFNISNVATSGGGTNYALRIDSTGVVYRDSSSIRYKENVIGLTDNFDAILEVEPKQYNFIAQSDGSKEIGYLAEDFDAKGLTNLVIYDSQGRPDGIHYEKIPLYLLEVIKKQQNDINQLMASSGTGDLGTIENLTAGAFSANTANITSITTNELTAVNVNVTGMLTTKQIETELLKAVNSKSLSVMLSDSIGATSFNVINSDNTPLFNVASNGNVSVLGKLIFVADTASASVGTAIVPINTTEVRIDTTACTDASKVFVTVNDGISSSFPIIKISEKGDGYFIIKLNQQQATEVGIDWWVIN